MSEGFKGIVKGGWHPKGKDGGKESWRGDFKGINQVAGWVGKGKSSETQAAREHVSRPLTTLKDPALFGPPPKNVNYHGGAALPNEITPHRGGLGAPLTQTEIADSQQQVVQEEQEPAKPPPPALPYRVNTTGQRTDQFLPPPSAVRRDVPPPPPARSPAPAPAPPPRLPARQNTQPSPVAEAPPPTYDSTVSQSSTNSWLNQKSANNLSRAGISVPALGIGGSQQESNPWKEEKSQSSGRGQLSELQSRFARMNSNTQENAEASNAPAQSSSQANLPSWKQSQSAFQTAQTMRTNPQNVTMADAQNAAQTADQTRKSVNAFREKHADSIANAQAKAKAWDQKYKMTSKLNKFLDEHENDPSQQQQQQQQTPHPQQPTQKQQYQPVTTQPQPPNTLYNRPPPVPSHPSTNQLAQSPSPSPTPAIDMSATSIARKPPPPPAPRKPANLQAPPPVPTGTKPNFA